MRKPPLSKHSPYPYAGRRNMFSIVVVSVVITLLSSFCVGFSVAPRRRQVSRSLLQASRRNARPREYTQDGMAIVNLDDDTSSNNNQMNHDLIAACDFSDTYGGPDQERRTLDGERIYYRLGKVEQGQWVPDKEPKRPLPHLYETSHQVKGDLIIDKNGYAWRTQEALRAKGLTRHNMEATPQLWRPYMSTNDTNVIQIPIAWSGPLDLPPQERGLGANRKLRDDLQFGCELDDERWLVYYTRLVLYQKNHGNVDVPQEWEEDEALGRWVNKQRLLYRRYARNDYYQHEIKTDGRLGRKIISLSPWRIQMLYDLGFSFKIHLGWQDRLSQLERFKEKYGHVQVPSDEEEFQGLHVWVQRQRTNYRRFKHDLPTSMNKRRFVLLDRLGLDWDPLASIWESRIEQLKEFRTEHGHVRVTKAQNMELALWLIYMRSQYRIYQETPWESALTQERIEELEGLGMDWEPILNQWQQQLEALVEFRDQNGHCMVPVDYPDNPSLSIWCQKQRLNYKNGLLSEDCTEKLLSIGFVFSVYDAAFEKGLDRLRAYKEVHGDCRVPRSYSDKELVSFVHRQRNQYRRRKNGDSSSLTKERIQKLEGLGFEWQVRNRNAWNDNFEKLRAFCEKHGHCNVPSDYVDESLYHFVATQRTQYKRLQNGESQPLTPKRITKLEELGFVWNTRDAAWMERYNELVEFQREHGHCNVPDKYSSSPALGKWVTNQRSRYRNLKKGKKPAITPSRVELLEKIGFQWSLKKVVAS